METRRDEPLVLTHHYRDRCAERAIPPDAADVVRRHGETLPGRCSPEIIWYLSPLAALNGATQQLDLWRYVGVAVVVCEDRAVTAFWMDEDEARRRRGARVLS